MDSVSVREAEKIKITKLLRCVGKRAVLLVLGGAVYYSMEIIWRGYSHWTMALCGGICLMSIYRMNCLLCRKRLVLRAALGSGIITAVELVCGCIVNRALNWNVWDYSDVPLNLLGQICLPFTVLWFAICFPVCLLCNFLKTKCFHD